VFLLEHLVDTPAQAVSVAVGADAGIGRADDFERGDAGGGESGLALNVP